MVPRSEKVCPLSILDLPLEYNAHPDTIPADVERVVNAASTSTLVPTPPQIEEAERTNNIFPLARQGKFDIRSPVNIY